MLAVRGPVASLLVGLVGCGPGPSAPSGEFEDGTYVIRVAVPLVAEGSATPQWMTEEPWILVTKSGSSLVVTRSADELVARGPAALFEPRGARWAVRLVLRVGPSHRYWALDLTSSDCASAHAVDADPALAPGGVAVVTYAGCAIEPQ